MAQTMEFSSPMAGISDAADWASETECKSSQPLVADKTLHDFSEGEGVAARKFIASDAEEAREFGRAIEIQAACFVAVVDAELDGADVFHFGVGEAVEFAADGGVEIISDGQRRLAKERESRPCRRSVRGRPGWRQCGTRRWRR